MKRKSKSGFMLPTQCNLCSYYDKTEDNKNFCLKRNMILYNITGCLDGKENTNMKGLLNPMENKVKTRYFEHVPVDEFMEAVKNVKEEDTNHCIERTSYEIQLPKRATKESAGYDFFSPFDFMIQPGEEIKIPTGVCVHMKPGEVLLMYPRSGHGFKYYCRMANTVGVIDSDYVESDNHGHIFVKLRNEGKKNMYVKVGEAFCQAIFMPFLLVDEDSFDNGENRNGGMGSTTK